MLSKVFLTALLFTFSLRFSGAANISEIIEKNVTDAPLRAFLLNADDGTERLVRFTEFPMWGTTRDNSFAFVLELYGLKVAAELNDRGIVARTTRSALRSVLNETVMVQSASSEDEAATDFFLSDDYRAEQRRVRSEFVLNPRFIRDHDLAAKPAVQRVLRAKTDLKSVGALRLYIRRFEHEAFLKAGSAVKDPLVAFIRAQGFHVSNIEPDLAILNFKFIEITAVPNKPLDKEMLSKLLSLGIGGSPVFSFARYTLCEGTVLPDNGPTIIPFRP